MPRSGIHPSYVKTNVTCACGHVHETASTRGDFQTEICAFCHPFYTGKQKLLDAAGRIERFQKKYGRASLADGELPVAAAAPAAK
jgi:large subunit ribosomal protein L31